MTERMQQLILFIALIIVLITAFIVAKINHYDENLAPPYTYTHSEKR